MPSALPILYSFRRCPYAMRARMALHYAQITVTHREIMLRDKPAHLLSISPKGTVPVLLLPNGHVLEQSLDIMLWACTQNDPEGWLVHPDAAQQLISYNDGDFKWWLDHYKYAQRHPEKSQMDYRQLGEQFLAQLETTLRHTHYLLDNKPTLADIAIFPFIRQFAHVDLEWFHTAPYPQLRHWLNTCTAHPRFETIMQKRPLFLTTPN